MNTRREFVQGLAAAAGAPLLAAGAASAQQPPRRPAPTSARCSPSSRARPSRRTSRSPSCDESFTDRAAWKRQARGKLLELLHYAPPRATPGPRSSSGSTAATTSARRSSSTPPPTCGCPPTCWCPRRRDRPLPAVVALHDHGGFYLWGKEKLVETDDEHPVLTDFKQRYYAGTSIATALARQGYVVVVIDMFYWGERRMLLDDDPDDWRKRPKDITAGAGRRVQPAGAAERAAGRAGPSTRPGSPGRG